MPALEDLLEACAALHHHLCPRQVLGVRMGMFAGALLGLDLPQRDKRLLAIIETDGCGADGIAVATNCQVGRRTMRIEDYGKLASTFVDTVTGQSIRIVPRTHIRQTAAAYAPGARSRWDAQLLGYQRMSAEEMFSVQVVRLSASIEQIIGRPGRRVICDVCGEEIMNDRQVVREGQMLCKSCADGGYYTIAVEIRAALLCYPVNLA